MALERGNAIDAEIVNRGRETREHHGQLEYKLTL
jgi:hypothetical protein